MVTHRNRALKQWLEVILLAGLAAVLIGVVYLNSQVSLLLSIEPENLRNFVIGLNPATLSRRMAMAAGIYRPAQAQVEIISDSQDPAAAKVLFIGNSLTLCNRLPATLLEIIRAITPGKKIKIVQVAAPGLLLEEHWYQGKALAELKDKGPWDFVVLQEGSTAPFKEKGSMAQYVGLFAREIKATGARPVLFESWCNRGEPRQEVKTQAAIKEVYQEVAAKTGAMVVPVGDVFVKASVIDHKVDPFGPDGHHPSVSGTYLAACTFYATLFGSNPSGAASKLIPKPMASTLQEEAWNIYLSAPLRTAPRRPALRCESN